MNIPDDVVQNLWNWFMGVIWKNLEKWARSNLKYCHRSLMGEFSDNSEDQNAGRNVRNKGYAQEVFRWK